MGRDSRSSDVVHFLYVNDGKILWRTSFLPAEIASYVKSFGSALIDKRVKNHVIENQALILMPVVDLSPSLN